MPLYYYSNGQEITAGNGNQSFYLLHAELDDFVTDDNPVQEYAVETLPNEQADHENILKRKVLDHSSSPLHAMTLQQLRQLFLSLEHKLNGKRF